MLSQEEELAIGEPTYEVLEEGTVVYKLPSCKEIKEVATALKVAIDGQRTALDMQFKSDRVAIGKVQQLGFILQLPDGAIEVDPTYAVNSTESTEENQTDIIDIDPK